MKPSSPYVDNVVLHFVEEEPPRPAGPCPRTGGPHRWAYLAAGGQACGYCGAPRG